jgi:glycosyltransferase involved in cell wall biosynthesis
MSKPRICLIEPCHSHEEVLFPLVELLSDDYDVSVLAPQSLLDVDLLSRTKHLYASFPIRWNQKASKWSRLVRLPGKYWQIRRLVDSIRPELVLFNSTYTWLDLLLIVCLFSHLPKAQIIHEFHPILRPGMKWLYRRFGLNLVISDEVFKYLCEKHTGHRYLDYFLPIYFSAFEEACRHEPQVKRGDGEPLRLGVFGSVDKTRRNYDGLFQSLAAWSRSGRKACFQIHLVGKLPVEYREFIREHRIEHLVQYSETFVPFEEMFKILRDVDIVLFLIDSSVRDCDIYNRYKITGSSTLIKGFKKVCASSRDFRVDASLADKCIYYDGAQLEQVFSQIESGVINRDGLCAMESRYAGDAYLQKEQQQARLVSALRRLSGGSRM